MAKIMLVEDDKSLREIYSIRLVAEGYNIVSAGDGEEALALAAQERPDLIIADVMMPKISGFDMLDILRSQPETQNIKVIMMTALSSDDQRQRGESLGAERYLVKSQVGIEDVINTVHEVLGDKPTTDAKANIETLSNVPASPAPAAPSMAAVPTTAQTTVPPQNPAAGPAPIPTAPQPIPGQPVPAPAPAPQAAPIPPMNPNGGTPANFNQAPVAQPGAVAMPNAQPAAGAPIIPVTPNQVAAQPAAANGAPVAVPVAIPVIPPVAPVQSAVTMPTSIPPAGQNPNSAIQYTQRIQPNPALAAQAQKQNGGERVIQPIHDTNIESARQEMTRRFEEMLGDDPTPEPQAITTKTARNANPNVQRPVLNTPPQPVPVPEAATPANMTALAGMPPQIKQDPVQQAQNVRLAPGTQSQQNLVMQQMAKEPVPVAIEQLTSSKFQQAQAAQMRVAQAQQAAAQPAPQATPAQQAAAQPAVPQAAPAAPTQPDRQPTIAELSSQTNPVPMTPDIRLEPEIKPIQPGYISELQEQIAADSMPSDDAIDNAAAQMANELKDDDLTRRAKEQAKENGVSEVEQRAREMRAMAAIPPAVVSQAAASAQNNPNIHTEAN